MSAYEYEIPGAAALDLKAADPKEEPKAAEPKAEAASGDQKEEAASSL